jgi:CBS domain-containing protein
MDWLASGLPTEGPAAAQPRAASHARRDVPTGRPGERLGDVARRAREAGWDVAVVVDGARVVLGLLDQAAFARDPAASVETVMRPGPTTVRPHASLEELVETLRQADIDRRVVTTSDGQLLGVLMLRDAEHVLERSPARHRSA